MRSIITKNGQSVWDVAIQHMGNVETVFDILKLNTGIRTDETIETGTEIFLPDTADKQRVVDYYALNNLNPSTSIT